MYFSNAALSFVKQLHTDQKYIEALRKHDTVLVNEIYKLNARAVQSVLKEKGASAEEAGDIFQEALIDIYKLAADGKFVLTCPFQAFLVMVCKRKWINQVKKKSVAGVTKSVDDGYLQIADDANAAAVLLTDQLERETLVVSMLDKITERCKEIILASLQSKPQDEIADALGVSYGFYRKKKSNCMAALIDLVKQNRS